MWTGEPSWWGLNPAEGSYMRASVDLAGLVL